MREILFRGKRKDNGEWVEGGFFEWLKQPYIVANITDSSAKTNYEVIPETVGQYTGINIGNEKLFEGDILECHEDYDDSWGYSQTSVVIAVVIWDEENFCWSFEVDKKYRQPCNDWTWDNSFINGNIHDNPELLKGGADE